MEFTILKKSTKSKARRTRIVLPHGTIETPVYMPVGTNGSVKAIKHQDVSDMGYRLILGNTVLESRLSSRPADCTSSHHGPTISLPIQGASRFSPWLLSAR